MVRELPFFGVKRIVVGNNAAVIDRKDEFASAKGAFGKDALAVDRGGANFYIVLMNGAIIAAAQAQAASDTPRTGPDAE